MWALRRAANPLRVSARQVATVRGCTSLDVLLSADAKNAEQYSEQGCQISCCCSTPRPSTSRLSFSSGWSTWSRSFSSQTDANSGDNVDDLEDGFSDLEVPPEADKKDVALPSEESSDDDAVDGVGLLEDDADAKPDKEPMKKASQCPLLKMMLEAPRNGVSGTLKKWVDGGNTFDRSDIFYVILNLRKRKFYFKALQLLEWLEDSKLIELGERDYASRLDLVAKVHGVYKAEKYIESIPVSHRGEIVYRTLLANCVAEANVKKSEEVFNKMKDLGFPVTVFAINQLLLLYKRVDKKKIADVLAKMEKENVKPSLFTYKLLVDTKGALRDIAGMEKVVESMQAEGVEPDLLFQATIVKHYIFAGHREKAEAILESMEGGDIKGNRNACKILLPLYAFLGKKDDVERMWQVCEANPRLDECLSAIEAFGRLGDVETAEKVFEDMFATWKTLSSKFYNALMKVYAEQNLFEKGKELAKRMDEDGCRLGISTIDSLVKLYVGAGEVDKAESILHKLSKSNKMRPQYSSYLMLLDSYSKKGDIHNSEKVFDQLRQMGYNGRVRQYQLLLHAYLHANAPVYGFRERMKADNIFPNSVIASLLAATDPFNRKKTLSDML
ncbi:pentatricopeptide repeat-containing protein At1g80270, mitochondrial-like [Hordeum vulgare subsp. vulgare]|uniref:PROP1-like PPR domain-containing protein n=1 Tax=Hordeum vulgare subsp. vulgare TaxID=112509 RepID=A0A8I6WRE0_HORVV|nr:pentatricopeptide repeat-containing protein At1g80270, mitochondrial-like [Hordeum vulgare subsp. vulgare]